MSKLPIFLPDELLARLGGSRDALACLIPAFAESIANWRRDLPLALAANDADHVRRLAHQAKGALLTFAAPRAAATAKALEDLARWGDFNQMKQMSALLLDEAAQVQAEVARLLTPPSQN